MCMSSMHGQDSVMDRVGQTTWLLLAVSKQHKNQSNAVLVSCPMRTLHTYVVPNVRITGWSLPLISAYWLHAVRNS